VAQLCSTCVLTLTNITIADDRRGTGGAVDFVSGQNGSLVIIKDAARARIACAPVNASLSILAATPRAAGWPGVQSAVALPPITWQGVTYNHALRVDDLAMAVPQELQEGRAPLYGYTLVSARGVWEGNRAAAAAVT
jgi:hypothetical protein